MAYPGIVAGLSIIPKPTIINKNCGINSGSAKGYVCLCDNAGVSVYLEKGVGMGYIEVIMTHETFGLNFMDDRARPNNIGYKRTRHYTKRYPEDFLGGR